MLWQAEGRTQTIGFLCDYGTYDAHNKLGENGRTAETEILWPAEDLPAEAWEVLIVTSHGLSRKLSHHEMQ